MSILPKQSKEISSQTKIDQRDPSLINLKICARAKEKANPNAWNYLIGGSELELAVRRNKSSFQHWQFMPSILTDVTNLETKVDFFGIPFRLPVLAAPIGGMVQFHSEGDIEWARGLSHAQIPGVVSGVARLPVEDIIKNSTIPLMYQLYCFGDDDWIKEQVVRAEQLGFKALVITIDKCYFAKHFRRDLTHYSALEVGWGKVPQPPSRALIARLDEHLLKKIQKFTNLPIILKGISSIQDIELASSLGITDFWVSNHGGRSLDNMPSSLEMMVYLKEALDKHASCVILDGGIRGGSDVILSLMMGADIVSVGRLPVYGLIDEGAAGINKVFENLESEIHSAMRLLGIKSLEGLKRKGSRYLYQSKNNQYISTPWDELENNGIKVI